MRALWSWGPLAAYLGLIFFLSTIPGEDVPMPGFVFADKLAHTIEYSICGALFARALAHWPGWRGRGLVAAAALAGALYGASDEVHQGLYPERHRVSDPFDAAADAVGSLVGAVVWVRIAHRRRAA